jgi:hypothetical protein
MSGGPPRRSERKSMAATKLCACCRKTKSLEAFGENLKMKRKKKSYCRACEKKKKAEWRARHAQKNPNTRGSVK